MPKDSRKIHSGVRIGKTVYTEGMEDELSNVLSPLDAARLIENGAIEGDWKTAKSSKTDPAADKEPAKETEKPTAKSK